MTAWLHELRQDSVMVDLLVRSVGTGVPHHVQWPGVGKHMALLQAQEGEEFSGAPLASAMDIFVGAPPCLCCCCCWHCAPRLPCKGCACQTLQAPGR